jgi:aspartyl-tRNA(Asn)/glutamyl-tRNA(Gln) amidotransferase subunit A
LDLGISALNYVNSIKNNEFTVEEFISESLEHINQVDKKLHAFLRINDFAIKNAREIDTKIKSNQNVGKCYGMPVSIKDIFA